MVGVDPTNNVIATTHEIPFIDMPIEIVQSKTIVAILDGHGFHYFFKSKRNTRANFVMGKF